MKCPQCHKEMELKAWRKDGTQEWKCLKPKCSQFLPVKKVVKL